MSEEQKLEHKEKIKRLEIKKIDKLDSLAGKIGIIVASLLFIITLIVTLLVNS
jgi:hypothetical protein